MKAPHGLLCRLRLAQLLAYLWSLSSTLLLCYVLRHWPAEDRCGLATGVCRVVGMGPTVMATLTPPELSPIVRLQEL